MMIVPASKKIRYTRVQHIDSDRLIRRYIYLRANTARLARECDGRAALSALAREIIVIERELCRRYGLTPRF